MKNKAITVKNKDIIGEHKEMKLTDIKPFVRYAQIIPIYDPPMFADTRAYDNRLFYINDGSGIIFIDDDEYKVQKGDFIMWKSGLKYSLTSKDGSMELLGINFDFDFSHSDLEMPIPPEKDAFKSGEIIETVFFTDCEPFNSPVLIRSFPTAKDILTAVLDEYRKARVLSAEVASSYVRVLLLTAARRAVDGIGEKNASPNDIIDYINKHCTEPSSNFSLAERFGYHPNHLSAIVLKKTGMSLHKYILKCRIMRSIDLLQSTEMTAAEIAFACGFTDYGNFLKAFKRMTGRGTKDFR